MVYKHGSGLSAIPVSISLTEYIERRLLSNALEGELTDYESSGSEDDDHPGDDSEASADTPSEDGEVSNNGQSTKKRKQRARYSAHRKEMRQKVQEDEGTDIKGVCKKRVMESTNDALQVEYSLLGDASVSGSGWIGKRTKGLPLHNPTLQELIDQDKLAYFPWDGR